jgi:hypothetical protein
VARIRLLAFMLVFFACTSPGRQFTVDYDKLSPKAKAYFGSKDNLSSRLFVLSHYGLPIMAGDRTHSCGVFDVEDLFVKDGYPPTEEVWTWKDCSVTFYSLADLAYDYVPPQCPPGDVQLRLRDTCTQEEGRFVVEFQIDGLKEEQHRTLYKVQILAKGNHERSRWVYLYDTSPIVGRTGLRSVYLTAYVDHSVLPCLFLRKGEEETEIMLLVVIWDFLSSEKREAVLALPVNGRRG